MSFFKKYKFILIIIFFAGATQALGFSNAVTSNKTQVPVLVFHNFGEMKDKETNLVIHYRITPAVFEKQMKYLSDNGYAPISFSTYIDSLKNGAGIPGKAVVLSFDDGWSTQYKYAVPILEKYHFTATFFIITKSIGGAYMTWDNLKDLVAHGFDIESHTQTHPKLTKLNQQKLKDELIGSKKTLEDKLGIKVTTVAYPYYLQNTNVREAVRYAGYVGARAGWAKFKNSVDHIYEIVAQESVNNPNPFSSHRLPDLP